MTIETMKAMSTALFVGSDDLCDPSLEECPTSEELTNYEDYELYTVFIGIILTIAGYMPFFFFL